MTVTSIRFGTDGWRGVIADDFTFDNLRRIASATGDYFLSLPDAKSKPVLIGYDRRFFSPEFARTVATELARQGLRPTLADSPLPTPAVSVCIAQQGWPWGLMMTASHNPAAYNGFKVKEGKGRSAPPEITREIEKRLTHVPLLGDGNRSSAPVPLFAWRMIYETYLRSRLDWHALRSLRGTVIFDHLFGVASGIPERLLEGTRARCISLHASHDPLFGGLHPEPIDPYLDALRSEVRKRHAIVGIAMDGDADRLGIVDDRGATLTPHQVFPLLALYAIEEKGWKGKIVQSVSLGALGPRIAHAFGLPFEEVPVGFKHVADCMLKEDVVAGGEESGGYAFHGGLPERDGILNGLLFLELIARRGKKPSTLIKEMESRFGAARFKRVDFALKSPIQDRNAFTQSLAGRLPAKIAGQSVENVKTLDGIKIFLKNGSWVLLRPSGTEPLIRTYAESASWKDTDRLLAWAKEAIR